jgi:ferric-dicitrate binding protein FerR (iron transport regulator)
VNDELFAGDVINTFGGGRLVLGLLDGSQAIVGEKTVVEIVDLSKSPRTIFNLLRGKARVKIEKVGGRPNPYRVNTPTTVIAVRGTLFDIFVTSKETQVFVHEGEVAVSNFARPDEEVILSPGQRTRVQQTQPPEPPSRFQPGRNNDTFKPDGHERDADEGRRAENREDRQSPSRREDDRQRQPGGKRHDLN